MIETVARKVSPKEEQQTINLMSYFGWNLKSSQEINSVDSHLERRDDTIYNVTTKENYVKLHFVRDTKRKNYNRIVQLETMYFELLNMQPILPKWQIYLSLFIGVLTLMIWAIPGILLLCYFMKKYKNRFVEWKQNFDLEGNKILREAQSLL